MEMIIRLPDDEDYVKDREITILDKEKRIVGRILKVTRPWNNTQVTLVLQVLKVEDAS